MRLLTVGIVAGALAASAPFVDFARAQSLDGLEAAGKAEGSIVSIGIPDDWANWGGIWKDITAKYGVTHTDTDMSSAEELAKFEAEKANASADIGEIGVEFGPIAVKRGLSVAYKPRNWDKIPDWRKTTTAIGRSTTPAPSRSSFPRTSRTRRRASPISSTAIKVNVGEVGKAAQSNAAVLAAAVARGGDENNLQPAIDLFAKLAEQKRLFAINVGPALI